MTLSLYNQAKDRIHAARQFDEIRGNAKMLWNGRVSPSPGARVALEVIMAMQSVLEQEAQVLREQARQLNAEYRDRAQTQHGTGDNPPARDSGSSSHRNDAL